MLVFKYLCVNKIIFINSTMFIRFSSLVLKWNSKRLFRIIKIFFYLNLRWMLILVNFLLLWMIFSLLMLIVKSHIISRMFLIIRGSHNFRQIIVFFIKIIAFNIIIIRHCGFVTFNLIWSLLFFYASWSVCHLVRVYLV